VAVGCFKTFARHSKRPHRGRFFQIHTCSPQHHHKQSWIFSAVLHASFYLVRHADKAPASRLFSDASTPSRFLWRWRGVLTTYPARCRCQDQEKPLLDSRLVDQLFHKLGRCRLHVCRVWTGHPECEFPVFPPCRVPWYDPNSWSGSRRTWATLGVGRQCEGRDSNPHQFKTTPAAPRLIRAACKDELTSPIWAHPACRHTTGFALFGCLVRLCNASSLGDWSHFANKITENFLTGQQLIQN